MLMPTILWLPLQILPCESHRVSQNIQVGTHFMERKSASIKRKKVQEGTSLSLSQLQSNNYFSHSHAHFKEVHYSGAYPGTPWHTLGRPDIPNISTRETLESLQIHSSIENLLKSCLWSIYKRRFYSAKIWGQANKGVMRACWGWGGLGQLGILELLDCEGQIGTSEKLKYWR